MALLPQGHLVTKLAAAVREALDMDAVYEILGLERPGTSTDR